MLLPKIPYEIIKKGRGQDEAVHPVQKTSMARKEV
jgi:hypothetical protein